MLQQEVFASLDNLFSRFSGLPVFIISNGASKDEIMETLRVANFISRVGCIYTAARALKEIF